MQYVSVIRSNGLGGVTKFMDFDTKAEAEEFVAKAAARFPGAFYAANPGGHFRDWLVVGGVLTFSKAAPIPEPTPETIYRGHLNRDPVLKALLLALNDGSIVPGANATAAQLKTAIKAKL